jgi:hypothetical protein
LSVHNVSHSSNQDGLHRIQVIQRNQEVFGRALTAVSMRYDMTSPCRSQSFLMNDANQQAIVVRHFYEVRHKK